MYIHLFGSPHVEVDGFDTADMGPHTTMNARTPNAEKDASIGRVSGKKTAREWRVTGSMMPSEDLVGGVRWREDGMNRRTVSFAVCAELVLWPLYELAEDL